jgi:hypothetical protein
MVNMWLTFLWAPFIPSSAEFRVKMKEKTCHLNTATFTGCSTQNWFILILRTDIKLSKQNPGFLNATVTVQFYLSFEANRVPIMGGIMFCDL